MGGPTSEWPAKGGDDGENEVPQVLDAATGVSLDAGAPRPVDDCAPADASAADGGVSAADGGGCR